MTDPAARHTEAARRAQHDPAAEHTEGARRAVEQRDLRALLRHMAGWMYAVAEVRRR